MGVVLSLPGKIIMNSLYVDILQKYPDQLSRRHWKPWKALLSWNKHRRPYSWKHNHSCADNNSTSSLGLTIPCMGSTEPHSLSLGLLEAIMDISAANSNALEVSNRLTV